jgi:hypothetical protein
MATISFDLRVRSLSGAALRRRWQAEFGRPGELLRRMIANKIQEEAFSTLDRATLKLLESLARRDAARRGERNLKIGTVLVRDYQGRRAAAAHKGTASGKRGGLADAGQHRGDTVPIWRPMINVQTSCSLSPRSVLRFCN